MSRMEIWYTCHEVPVDDAGNETGYFTHDLPHSDEIGDAICDSWNSAKMEQYFDGILSGKIRSCPMTYRCCHKPEGWESNAVITIIGEPGIRFTEKIRNEIRVQIDAQLSDGWGESFFGAGNIMTGSNGTGYYVE